MKIGFTLVVTMISFKLDVLVLLVDRYLLLFRLTLLEQFKNYLMSDCKSRSELINLESYLKLNKIRLQEVLASFLILSEILCLNPLLDLDHASTSCSIVQIQVFLQNVFYLYFLSFSNQLLCSFPNLTSNFLQPVILRFQSFLKISNLLQSLYVQTHYFLTLSLNLSMQSLLLIQILCFIELYFKLVLHGETTNNFCQRVNA